MTKVAIRALAVLLVTATPALAESAGLTNAKWCQTDTDPPSKAMALTALDPDGHPRGTRNAATLFAEAKKAALDGNDEKAIAWLLLRQWQNAGAQNDIRADRAAILHHLRQ